mmetsp:Transcript_13474/g.41604  ORF Transcript_13474/g.41604 Transcript_13474/m.41604 type:complete len:218 (+) Transcript_13474:369-1022(+)
MPCSACGLAAALAATAYALREPVRCAPVVAQASRRAFFSSAALAFPAVASAATSSELKGMLGNLDEELSDANLAKMRGTEEKAPLIDLPSVNLPKPTFSPPKPKPGKAKVEKAKAEKVAVEFEPVDLGSVVPDFGASAREEGRRRAEAKRAAAAANAAPSRASAAPANSGDVDGGEVYAELRAKREAQRQRMEAREDQRKFNRLTATEQAKARAAGK